MGNTTSTCLEGSKIILTKLFGMSTSSSEMMMKAEASSGREIGLDPFSSGLVKFTVTFALLYPGSAASPEELSAAFCKVLPSFEPLAGRLVKRGDKLAILCNNAGVPLTIDKRAEEAPSFAQPIPEDLFDMVRNHEPISDEPGVVGDAPMRVKVTNFNDAQVLAVCWNHSLGDARSIGLFMSAWAEAFRGGSGERQVSHDRILLTPPRPAPGGPPISKAEGVPTEWPALRGSGLSKMELEPLKSAMFVCMKKSPDACAALKAKCMQEKMTDVAFVSTNDAVSSEILAAIDCEGDAENTNVASFPLGMIMDYRDYVGTKTLFSNVMTFLTFPVHHSLAAASDIRKVLPKAMNGEFIKWHLGQGQQAFNIKLMMNTWAKAIKLDDLAFAGPAADIMLGKPMLAQRAAIIVPMGVSYCFMLPTLNGGVKMAGVCSKATAEKLKDGGSEVTMTPVNDVHVPNGLDSKPRQ